MNWQHLLNDPIISQEQINEIVNKASASNTSVGSTDDNISTSSTQSQLTQETFASITHNKSSIGEDSFKSDQAFIPLSFDIPDWGIEDFIDERNKFQKGIRSVADEQGWYYFKVFFKFNTNYGLLGGLLGDKNILDVGEHYRQQSSNTAIQYLDTIKQLYRQEQIPHRINALLKFANILSKLNTEYPWLIKGVNGLDKTMDPYTKDFSKEKSFELVFNNDTIDMKLTNLLDTYRYACFDDINCKEIIPENLRKFDMMIVMFNMPIKYYQTAIMTSPKKDLRTGLFDKGGLLENEKIAKTEAIIEKSVNFLTAKSAYYKYKRLNPTGNNTDDRSNTMTFRMFTFHNCEIDQQSLGKVFEGAEVKNDTPFQMGTTTIKINYDRVYFHNNNEWNQYMFGSDGFWYDPAFPGGTGIETDQENAIRGGKEFSDSHNKRMKSLKETYGVRFFDKNAEQYQALIDYSESLIMDGLMDMNMKEYYSFMDGNIYGKIVDMESEYQKNKLKYLKEGGIESGNLYGNLTNKNIENGYQQLKLKYFGKTKNKGANIYGVDLNPGSNYFKEKLEWLANNKTGESWNVESQMSTLKSVDSNLDPYGEQELQLLYNKEAQENQLRLKPMAQLETNIYNYTLTGQNGGSLSGVQDILNEQAAFWNPSQFRRK